MKPLLHRRAMRRTTTQFRTYGVTAALGLFSLGGVLPQCAPPPPPAVVQVADVQHSVVASVNQHRAQSGRRAVTVDSRLTAAAKAHSSHMARERIMTHVGAGWTNAGQRIESAGYRWRTWAENVAAGQTTPAQVMSAWMNSPGHRANILHSGVTEIGVAATKASNGTIYWTMVLATD